MKKVSVAFLIIAFTLFGATQAKAQVKVEDILNQAIDLLNNKQILTVKKGFSPVFNLGSLQINKVGILGEQLKGIGVLGEIFNKKNIDQVTKLYKTYKTGLVVFKVLGAAGTAVAAYGTIKGVTGNNSFSTQAKSLIVPALGSVLTGVVTKVLTKKASYKAVDIFNGVVRNKVKDIFSIAPASQNAGIGLYVKL